MSTLVVLEHPSNASVKELAMRRPKVKDVLLGDDNDDDSNAVKEVALFAVLCDVSPAEIESLDFADYLQLQRVYQGFLD